MADDNSEKKQDLDRAIRKLQGMIDRLRVTEAAIKGGGEAESILIGGEWLKLAKSFPVATFYGEKIADVTLAERDILNAAIGHSYAARDVISATPLVERSGLLLSFLRIFSSKKEELARLNSKITGEPLKHSLEQAEAAMGLFGEIAHQVIPAEQRTFYENGKQKMVLKDSAGVLAAFVHSDTAIIDASTLIAISVATLTPVILLPSRQNSLVLLNIGRYAVDSGIPPGLITVICGDDAEFVQEVAENRKVATVLFSGPDADAAAIGSAAGKGLKKMHMETPKKELFIICDDCSIEGSAEDVANHVAKRAFPAVVFVEQGAFDAFLSLLESKIKSLEKGDPLSQKAGMRVFSEGALAGFRDALNEAGKKHVLGVQMDRHFLPAVYPGGEFDAELVQKVRNLPAAIVFRSSSLGYALHYARNLKVKNASVYTNSIQNAFAAARDLNADTVSVNSPPAPSYEEWLKIASRNKRINLAGLALQ